jgi:peptidoglycan lytic transglycosylase
MVHLRASIFTAHPTTAVDISSLSNGQKRMPPFRPVFLFFLFTLSLLLLANVQADAQNQYYSPTQQPYVIDNQVYHPLPSASGFKEIGIASWYGPDFNGHTTSNGEIYNMYGQTAAHKLLPMNTILLVSNLENGRSTIVRINDRGPFIQGRILDLSYTAAKKLDLVDNGTAKVRVTAIGRAGNTTAEPAVSSQNIDFNLGEFYIQVGAFQRKGNALRLQRKFAEFGHSTIIQQFFSQKSILYRVCVYAGRELQGAYTAEKALHQHGWLGAFVVAK